MRFLSDAECAVRKVGTATVVTVLHTAAV